MNNKEFAVKMKTYSVMRQFAEFKVVTDKSSVFCVGGCDFVNNEVTIKQDFFKETKIDPFIDFDGNFTIESDDQSACIEFNGKDGITKIHCLKPISDDYFGVEHAVYNEKSFCNPYISDDDSREINGVYYNVVNPARTKDSCIDPEIIGDMRSVFHSEDFSDKTLKLFYVKDFEKRVFFIGLWDAENHCPIFDDPTAPSNSDYSDEYSLFYP